MSMMQSPLVIVPGHPRPHSAVVGAAPSPGGVRGEEGRRIETLTRSPVFTQAAHVVEGVRSSQISATAGVVRIDTRSPPELAETTVSNLPAFESERTVDLPFNTTT
jgi:hypothetical protein